MHERYDDLFITDLWGYPSKLNYWQRVELEATRARENLGVFPADTHLIISGLLNEHPIDIEWWKKRDAEIHHDLNAFLDERLRFLPEEMHQYFHAGMTSYDTEEPALALMLLTSVSRVQEQVRGVLRVLNELAIFHQHTPMLGRTHGQEAKIQSFGKRCYSWLTRVMLANNQLEDAKELLLYSKMSGAIGNYQGMTPEEEKKTLALMGLKPFSGATQIVPRDLHLPTVNALEQLVAALTQIAEDVRLNARSGLPLMREPFGKKQKGSSAMPHKKNTITCENQIGMYRLARGYVCMLRDNLMTWEERAIEQSCVERVAWRDIFHVTCRSIKNMERVLGGLQVYPENMHEEIRRSRGTYASEDAKDWLKENGFSHEEAYRIVQLAAFNAFERKGEMMDLIITGILSVSDELEAGEEEVRSWNERLQSLFNKEEINLAFERIFSIEYQLRGESAFAYRHAHPDCID